MWRDLRKDIRLLFEATYGVSSREEFLKKVPEWGREQEEMQQRHEEWKKEMDEKGVESQRLLDDLDKKLEDLHATGEEVEIELLEAMGETKASLAAREAQIHKGHGQS